MTKQEQINKYMKGLKGYITKEFIFVKEGDDECGIGYLFIMEEHFLYIYNENDEVYIRNMGPIDNKEETGEINETLMKLKKGI